MFVNYVFSHKIIPPIVVFFVILMSSLPSVF